MNRTKRTEEVQIDFPPGYKEPIAKPLNCKCGESCCYGYGKAFCFPCYRRIMEARRTPIEDRGMA